MGTETANASISARRSSLSATFHRWAEIELLSPARSLSQWNRTVSLGFCSVCTETASASTIRTLGNLRRDGGSGSFAQFLAVKWVPPLSSYASFSSAPSVSSAYDSSPSSSSTQGKPSRWSRWLLFLPGAITFGLGTWQIVRRQEKIKMLEYREKRLQMEPLKFSSASPSTEELDSLEFRKVVYKGVFDEKKPIYVGPRSRSISGVTENGYYIVTPLMPFPSLPDSVGFPVLVNRGWVPHSWKDKLIEVSQDGGEQSVHAFHFPSETNATGSWRRFWSRKPDIIEDHVPSVIPVEVVGVVRGSENPSIFVPTNDPESSQWFYVDVLGIAHAFGLSENTHYIEDVNENVNPSNPYPVPKDVNTLIRSSVMPQNHLNYALTWYSLSAAVTCMAFKRLRLQNKLG